MLEGNPRFDAAIREFDAAHGEDPKIIVVDGRQVPWSLHYHMRLAHWVKQLEKTPSEALLLAAHCQHIRRWTIPRSSYPMNRNGYRQWRKTLARFHAKEAAKILKAAGYEEETIHRLKQLLLKIRLKLDPEVQLFEDAICLVFLENELSDFAEKHDQEKLISILQKTWKKMSSRGHQAAQELTKSLPAKAAQLLEKALGAGPSNR